MQSPGKASGDGNLGGGPAKKNSTDENSNKKSSHKNNSLVLANEKPLPGGEAAQDDELQDELFQEEEKQTGSNSWQNYKNYYKYFATSTSGIFLFIILVVFRACTIYTQLLVGYWSENAYHFDDEIYYIYLYTIASFGAGVLAYLRQYYVSKRNFVVSQKMH